MKILYLIESLHAGGKERRLSELVDALSESSDIEIFILLVKSGIFYSSVCKPKIRIKIIERKWRKDPFLFWKIAREIRKISPDLIHSWGNMMSIYALPSVKLFGIPFITSEITDAPTEIPFKILSHRLTFPFADKIIANSSAGVNAYNPPLGKTVVIHNGINLSSSAAQYNIQEIKNALGVKTTLTVSMIANNTQLKDYSTFIKVAKSICQKNSAVSFLCVGSGDFSDYQVDLVDEYKERIRFLGLVKDVKPILAITDIGVLCSFTEGLSNTILEFMSFSKPVVFCGSGGLSEIIINGDNGFILPSGAVDELESTLRDLLLNESKRKKFGARSRIIIEEKFSLDKMVQQHLKVYGEFLCVE